MEKIMLVPKGTEQFRCIGAACEDHCCNTWRVDIDRVGFMKVSTSSNPVIKPLAKKAYKINSKATSDVNYGSMKMNDKNECHFLDENKWCQIHKELGESALCNTCSIYPRIYRKIGNVIEKSLTFSCPEVVRTLLLQQEGLSFEEAYPQANELIQSKATLSGIPEELMWKVRIFAITLLQERGLSLDTRILLLGIFSDLLSKEPLTEQSVENVISLMNQRLAHSQYVQAIEEVKGNELVQIQLHKELLRTTVEELSFNVRYVEVVNQFIVGLQTGPLEDKVVTETTLQKYMASQKIYQQFNETHSYILENYVVHYVFTNVFPYNSQTPLQAFGDIAVNYQLIKALLIGMAAHNGKVTVDDAVLVIQSYTKAVAHNNKSYKTLRQKIKESNMESLAFLFAYIKTNG
ncbi:flagellin lysine-N-methylase [Solibacillus sp. MA9]|uniref:Flagellin lysine-N-methylase n=1 Tax=Solibacillus palustris TaxID=2908203 RepID=A0ABS9U8J1_9BACL|nr:flagellin lysine-N-methylase [Solibacillus sp. MA9]MCH7320652.1 flagellin lysine-N-methylase [Solibacillus sp. MA9]